MAVSVGTTVGVAVGAGVAVAVAGTLAAVGVLAAGGNVAWLEHPVSCASKVMENAAVYAICLKLPESLALMRSFLDDGFFQRIDGANSIRDYKPIPKKNRAILGAQRPKSPGSIRFVDGVLTAQRPPKPPRNIILMDHDRSESRLAIPCAL
jgi:hypothetical protein